jgi:hypothetical protein
MLGLSLTWHEDAKQWRGPCPRCHDGGDRALVITPGKGYYCFAEKKGGDCIALAAHVLTLSMRDAAIRIAEQVDGDEEDDPSDARPQPDAPSPKAFVPLAYLVYEHDTVQALGLDTGTAQELGIGYAKKGIMRGRVAIPIRTEDGALIGYCGYAPQADPPLKFPKNLTAG